MKAPLSLHASFSTATRTVRRAQPLKIGIRSEDPTRIWERRAPLTPDAVYELIKTGNATVDIVSCAKRVFKDEEYQKAGARVVQSLRDPVLVLGIKEPPLEEVQNDPRQKDATHMMFSHTAKGQLYNMPLLAKFVNPQAGESGPFPRLIDYELLTNEQNGKRTVGFGWHAGVAGVLEALSSLGHYHLERGVATPFLYTPRPHTLPSLEELRAALRSIGIMIATGGLPALMGPCIIGVTGTGQVAEGALSMLKELPIEMIDAQDSHELLSRWSKGEHEMTKKIYLVHIKPADYLVRIDSGKPGGKSYNREHYYKSPHLYKSVFHTEIAPYLTLFINGTGWAPSFPRLMTNDQLAYAVRQGSMYTGARFTNIADISCDVGGGLEFMTKATTISSPFYKLAAPQLSADLPSVQMMSVDILPASIPLDASKHFSAALKPYLQQYLEWHMSDRQGDYPKALERATIAADGLLKEKHEWLYPIMTRTLEEMEKQEVADILDAAPVAPPRPAPARRKKIVMLGSGMVAQPAVDMIAQRSDVDLIIASNSLGELQALAAPHPNVEYRVLDLAAMDAKLGPIVDLTNLNVKGSPLYERELYNSLIRNSDVVISLLPAHMHPRIAKDCIKFEKHLVTASYISEEMAKLNDEAENVDVLLLNEIGLDPGVDHCSARDLIDRLWKDGKKIESFTSFCGGLPAPAASHVPLRYKFSWRPQGVLTAALNEARYLLKGEAKHVPGKHLLNHYFPSLPITTAFELEGLPNRNSLAYIASYDLDNEPLTTFVRGTLRYPGFSALMNSFARLGLLENTHYLGKLESWESFVPRTLAFNREFTGNLSSIIDSRDLEPLQDALEWLGLVKSPMLSSSQTPMPPLPIGLHTPLDIFAYLLSQKLRYQPHEQDMVVLSHEVITKKNRQREVHTSTLIAYGTEAHNKFFQGERPASAMARTVGYPVAIATLLVADGKIPLRGVQGPLAPEIYKPVLEGLGRVGLHMKETTMEIRKGTRTAEGTLILASELRKQFRNQGITSSNSLDLDSDPDFEKRAADDAIGEYRDRLL